MPGAEAKYLQQIKAIQEAHDDKEFKHITSNKILDKWREFYRDNPNHTNHLTHQELLKYVPDLPKYTPDQLRRIAHESGMQQEADQARVQGMSDAYDNDSYVGGALTKNKNKKHKTNYHTRKQSNKSNKSKKQIRKH